jgi:excisionase family DNA binding protein
MASRSRPRITRDDYRAGATPTTCDADERFMTIAGVATLLGVAGRTVRRWIQSGELPAYRFERMVRIAPRDLDAFLARWRVN